MLVKNRDFFIPHLHFTVTGRLATLPVRHLDVTLPWTLRYLDGSPPGRFAPLTVSIPGRFATSLDVSSPDDKD